MYNDMQNQTNANRIISRLFLLATILLLVNASRAIAQCPPGTPQFDIQSVSILATPSPVSVGQVATIRARIRNNGPCDIPTGGASAQVTISSTYFDCNTGLTPVNFQNICPTGPWSLLGVITGGGQHNLFFRNNAGSIPAGGQCEFTFQIRGLNITPCGFPGDITLVSDVNQSPGFDPQPLNQFVGTTLAVNPATSITCPSNITDICPNTPPIELTGGSPAGGTYSGPGVSGGIFNPATAGPGTHVITYSVTLTGCPSSCTFTIQVTAAPTVIDVHPI